MSQDPLIRAIGLLEDCFSWLRHYQPGDADYPAQQRVLAFLREQACCDGSLHEVDEIHHACKSWMREHFGCCAARAALERLEPKRRNCVPAWDCACCGGVHPTTETDCPHPERRMDWDKAERVLKDAIFQYAGLTDSDYAKVWLTKDRIHGGRYSPRALYYRWVSDERTRKLYDAIMQLSHD